MYFAIACFIISLECSFLYQNPMPTLLYILFVYREEMFTKLAKQIVWQRCLHPSFTVNPSVPIDPGLWLECCILQNNTPHIILTSSQLRTFIRVIIKICLVVCTTCLNILKYECVNEFMII